MTIKFKKDEQLIICSEEDIYYYHNYQIKINAKLSAYQVYCHMTSNPPWGLSLAFKIRDKISTIFGVKQIDGFKNKTESQVQVNDHLDFFLVEHITDSELALTSRDVHLSVMVFIKISEISSRLNLLSITTSVKIHNGFGKAYMLPVGLVHGIIVKALLKKMHVSLP